jgi:cytochrome b561
MIPDTNVAPNSPHMHDPEPSTRPISVAQTVSWAGLTLPLVACAAIWGIGDASPVNIAWLSVMHTVIGAAASAWTALRFVLRRRIGNAPPMAAGRLPAIGLLLLYTLLLLQPILSVAGSMLHGRATTLFGIPLPSVLPVNQMVAHGIDELHGWNALLLLGLISVHLASAFSATRHQQTC